MPEISYRAVVNTALSEEGYQGTTYTSKFTAFLDSVNWYCAAKQGATTWCCIFNDYCVAVNKGDLSYEQARQIVCEPANNKVNYGAGVKEKVQYYKQAGRWITDPSKCTTGDEIFFYKSGTKEYGHVGRVVDWDSKYIYTMEGSTTYNGKAHSVAKKQYPFNSTRIAGFGRPDWYKYQDEAPKPEPQPEPTPAPTPAPAPAPAAEKYRVTTNGSTLTLRAKPNTSSTNLANIPNGTILTITEIVQGEPIKYNTNWGKTTYNGKTGYVSLRWLTKL